MSQYGRPPPMQTTANTNAQQPNNMPQYPQNPQQPQGFGQPQQMQQAQSYGMPQQPQQQQQVQQQQFQQAQPYQQQYQPTQPQQQYNAPFNQATNQQPSGYGQQGQVQSQSATQQTQQGQPQYQGQQQPYTPNMPMPSNVQQQPTYPNPQHQTSYQQQPSQQQPQYQLPPSNQPAQSYPQMQGQPMPMPQNNMQQQQQPMPMPMPMNTNQMPVNNNNNNQMPMLNQQGSLPTSPHRPLIPPWVVPMDPRFLSMTVNAFPSSSNLRLRSELLYGIVLRPLAADNPEQENDIPVVNFGDVGVVRCDKCRGYINPFVEFLDGGHRWKCSMCYKHNPTPKDYFAAIDNNGMRQDIDQRPELKYSSVEIIAPMEYTVRQPMPPCYMFVIDVSKQAVASGMLETVCATILETLSELPGGKRTQIGFLTFDTSIHFYQLRSGARAPQMFVISDLNDLFLPVETDLLVNLDDCREVVEQLLDSLPRMHEYTEDVESALGPALDAATRVMARVGGKMEIFLSGLPSIGFGRLKNREDPRALGGPNEHKLLSPSEEFYQRSAHKLTRFQISCNLFVFSEHYADVSTLSQLSSNTGGHVFYYPNFRSNLHGSKLRHELRVDLTRITGWEAVVRTRVSEGVKIEKDKIHGSFFLRGADLLATPSIDSDKAFVFELINDEGTMSANHICIQSALLYTSSWGERRIRVHTHCVPVVNSVAQLYPAVNVNALINQLTKQTMICIVKDGFEKGRQMCRQRVYNILRACWNAVSRMQPQTTDLCVQAVAPLPLLLVAMVKHRGFRKATDVRVDTRAWLHSLMRTMGIPELETILRPRMIPLHNLQPGEGTEVDGKFILPQELALSMNELKRDGDTGAYLVDNGLDFYLRLGANVSPQFRYELFDEKTGTLRAPDDNPNSFCSRFQNILKYLRGLTQHYQQLVVIEAGTNNDGFFVSQMIEDQQGDEPSLNQIISDIRQKTGFQTPMMQLRGQQG